MADFSERLKTLRALKDLTQTQLAKEVKVSVSMIGMYESGKRMPSVENLEILSDYFNVDTDYLLGRSNYTNRLIDYKTLSLIDSYKGNNLMVSEDFEQVDKLYKILVKNKKLQEIIEETKDFNDDDLDAVLNQAILIRKAKG